MFVRSRCYIGVGRKVPRCTRASSLARAVDGIGSVAAMATRTEEAVPILKAASRHERSAPVQGGYDASDGACREFGGDAFDLDTELDSVSSSSRGTTGLSRGLRLAAATSSLALVALACLALGRGNTASAVLGDGDASSDSPEPEVPTERVWLTPDIISRDRETGRLYLKIDKEDWGELGAGVDGRDEHQLAHHPSANLGMDHPLGSECEYAVRDPENWGPNPAFTETLIGLLPYAEQTYVVCSSHCDMPIPSELQGKVKMVHGYEVDKCLSLEDQSHWVKASLTHGAAVAHAKAHKLGSLAVLEEDMTAEPAPYVWVQRDYDELNGFLGGPDKDTWNAMRLGYRPVDHEGPSPVGCARQCTCQAVGTTLCYIKDTQCQLHSSDAYILRSSMYDYVLGMVSVGGVIDFGVLQGVPNQIVITPQITFQTGFASESDRTDLGTQLATTSKFYDACMKPVVGAREAGVSASALGFRSQIEDSEEFVAWKRNTTPDAVQRLYAASLGNTEEVVALPPPLPPTPVAAPPPSPPLSPALRLASVLGGDSVAAETFGDEGAATEETERTEEEVVNQEEEEHQTQEVKEEEEQTEAEGTSDPMDEETSTEE